jgi:hypothetical protein
MLKKVRICHCEIYTKYQWQFEHEFSKQNPCIKLKPHSSLDYKPTAPEAIEPFWITSDRGNVLRILT